MKCLLKYQWVKLPRNQLPPGKGIMGAWARLASRAAFRNGHAKYCGYINKISVGGWAGGIVGLKSILGINRRQKALNLMGELADRGYCSAAGEVDCTEVYVVPASRFPEWLAAAQADDLKEEMLYETSEIWD